MKKDMISSTQDSEVAIASYEKNKKLPKSDSALVHFYQQNVEKDYNVDNSKKDIESCIELLHIAYTSTPMEASEIRIKIEEIQQDIIDAQSNAEIAMINAKEKAKNIIEDIRDNFEILHTLNESEKKEFMLNDFSPMVISIHDEAMLIYKDLLKVSNSFDNISQKALQVTNKSQTYLGAEMKDRKETEETIKKFKADEAELKSKLDDFVKAIKKYNDLAKSFEKKADKADDRAFIMGLVQIGANVLSSVTSVATSAIVMSTGGPAIGNASRSVKEFTSNDTKTSDDSSDGKKDLEDIKLNKKNDELKRDKIEEKLDSIKEDIKIKKSKLAEISKKAVEDIIVKAKVEQLEKDLKELNITFELENKSLIKINATIKTLSDSLAKLSDTASTIRKQEKDSSDKFRDLQMDFLNKAEKYEELKTKDAGQLAKLKVLLDTQSGKKKSIELTIQTLILSIKALKRMKSIIAEIGFFFSTFALSLKQIADEATRESKLIEKSKLSEKSDHLSFNAKKLFKKIDVFMIVQYAEWNVTQNLSSKFVTVFGDGRVMMNDLAGTYLDEKEREVFIHKASKRIEEIAKSREKESNIIMERIVKEKKNIENKIA